MLMLHCKPLARPVIRSAMLTALLVFTLALAGCSPKPASDSKNSNIGDRQIMAISTIGMIADIVRVVGGDRVVSEGLMAAGVDPHLYKASEGDVRKLAAADIIFYNGLNLEGKMGDLFVRMSASRPTVPVTENIDPKLLREPPEFAGHYDPHVWFDVTLWISAVQTVEEALSRLDPKHASAYAQRASGYIEELSHLDQFVAGRMAGIPKEQRVLVTAHDAFGYFGQRYDVEVVALQGISTATEAGVGDVKRIVDLVVMRRIKAIFVESSVPRRTIEAVVEASQARGHKVVIGGSLFSDAMGNPGTPEGNYIGMIRHNATTIADALK